MGDTLYAISNRLRDVIEQGFALDADTGEVFDSCDLDAIEVALSEKAEAVLAVSREYRGKAEMVAAEIKRLQEYKKYLERRGDSLDGYLAYAVETIGGPIDTAIGRVSVRRTKAVQVLDEEAVPMEFISQRISYSVDKRKVKDAIEGGESVPGCALVVNESVQVR